MCRGPSTNFSINKRSSPKEEAASCFERWYLEYTSYICDQIYILLPFFRFIIVPCDTHTLSSASSRCLDHNWIANVIRNFESMVQTI